MTPEEKAKELIYSFLEHTLYDEYDAKNCAALCAKEIQSAIPDGHTDIVIYWQKVEEEINQQKQS